MMLRGDCGLWKLIWGWGVMARRTQQEVMTLCPDRLK